MKTCPKESQFPPIAGTDDQLEWLLRVKNYYSDFICENIFV
jgi:hypothetical protein